MDIRFLTRRGRRRVVEAAAGGATQTRRAATGLEQVLLSVTRTQIAALALYRSLGFEPFGAESHALNIDGEFIDEHYLVLRLRETRD
jgi:ribosomal protein S18 acetylase RimI-like enzyme